MQPKASRYAPSKMKHWNPLVQLAHLKILVICAFLNSSMCLHQCRAMQIRMQNSANAHEVMMVYLHFLHVIMQCWEST